MRALRLAPHLHHLVELLMHDLHPPRPPLPICHQCPIVNANHDLCIPKRASPVPALPGLASPCRVVAYVVLLVVTHRGILAHNLVWPFMAGRFSRRIPTEVSPPGVSRLCLIDPEMGSVEPTCGRSGQCSALLCFPSWFWVFGSGSGSREAQSTVDRIVTEKSEGFLDI